MSLPTPLAYTVRTYTGGNTYVRGRADAKWAIAKALAEIEREPDPNYPSSESWELAEVMVTRAESRLGRRKRGRCKTARPEWVEVVTTRAPVAA